MISENTEQTTDIAKDFIKQIMSDKSSSEATIVALVGDLGAGKTAFTQACARALGIEETVTSPTFVIEKIYKIDTPRFNKLVHIDAYRLENSQELATLGFDNLIADSKNLIFIEWADKVYDLLPKGYIKIIFSVVSDTVRKIDFEYA